MRFLFVFNNGRHVLINIIGNFVKLNEKYELNSELFLVSQIYIYNKKFIVSYFTTAFILKKLVNQSQYDKLLEYRSFLTTKLI